MKMLERESSLTSFRCSDKRWSALEFIQLEMVEFELIERYVIHSLKLLSEQSITRLSLLLSEANIFSGCLPLHAVDLDLNLLKFTRLVLWVSNSVMLPHLLHFPEVSLNLNDTVSVPRRIDVNIVAFYHIISAHFN